MRIPVPFPCLPQKWNEAEEACLGVGECGPRQNPRKAHSLHRQCTGYSAKAKRELEVEGSDQAAIAVTICSAQSSAALRSRRVQVRLAGQTEKGGIKCSAAHDPDALMAPYHCHLFPCIFISNFSWPLLNVNSCKCFKTYLNIWKYLSGWSKRYSLKLREVLRLSVQK